MPAHPSLAHHFATEAYQNAWANHRLLTACARLTDAELAAPRTGFFPSIKATLNHILTVDWYYVDALERSRAGKAANAEAARFFEPEEPFEHAAELAREQRAVDRRLIALCESLDDEALEDAVLVPRRTGVQRESVRRVLAHLFQHDIHHRGQVHAMLSGTRVKPPQLDEFYCANEATLRADDFRALGFDEGTIWRDR